MLRIAYTYLIGFFLFLQVGFGQNKKTDSLLAVLTPAKEDSSKVETLIALFNQMLPTHVDSARMFATQAIELSEKINYNKGLARSLKSMGTSYYNKSNDKMVLEYWNKSLDVYKSIKDSLGESIMLSNIGAVYMNASDDETAIKYYVNSLEIAEKINNKLQIAKLLNNMGAVYKHKAATKGKAKQNYLRALSTLEDLNDRNGIGTTCSNLGEIYMANSQYDSALFYFNKSLISYVNTDETAKPLRHMGTIYDSLNNYPKAIENFSKVDSIGKKIGDVRYQVQAALGLANVYGKMNNQQKSFESYRRAEELASKAGYIAYLEASYQGLSRIYAERNDYQNAFKYERLLTSVKDTIYNIESEKNLKAIVSDYEIEKKEDSINLLSTKNQLADLQLNRANFAKNALIAGLGLVSLIIFILYRDYRNKTKTNKLLDSQKAQIQTLLSNILPDEVAEELQRDGFATPKFYESASVLFTDFKSFTKHADHMTPQEVIAELNSCFIAFDDIMGKYNLEKIKTIGDAYMCAGGIPVADPNHYWNMIKAAKDIQATIQMRNNERVAKELPPWEIRIGIHVGPIVAGVVGKKKYAYDIWGSTVNIASRMESNGEPGQINISSSTYELIKDKYNCTHRGKIYAKNVGDIDMYFLGEEIKKGESLRENMDIAV